MQLLSRREVVLVWSSQLHLSLEDSQANLGKGLILDWPDCLGAGENCAKEGQREREMEHRSSNITEGKPLLRTWKKASAATAREVPIGATSSKRTYSVSLERPLT